MNSMDMEHFSKITDFLLFKIKLDSTEGNLLKFEAKMIENIFKRNLFECVFESSPIKADIFDRNKTKIEIEDELKTMIVDDSNSHGIQPNLFIKMTYLDFGMKEANPVERLKVYSKDDFTKARHFTKEEASKVFGPATFNEVIVRVFLNNTNRMYSTDVMGRLRESSEKTIKALVK
ncbi:deoxynucleoside triphosphate triphosphohydrolase SAMHD1-like [Physella acuta]|uniref:deoxynucleoside triphosphate triphosphohydrolase SAMHD1-like n=1 Tax=Physella acuta TaxID=109671 RepID=UPI0027DE03F6|nr:deoxynucleoside triphosphate triphosphohydrolase SAMHD1-like [Physella acuta]